MATRAAHNQGWNPSSHGTRAQEQGKRHREDGANRELDITSFGRTIPPADEDDSDGDDVAIMRRTVLQETVQHIAVHRPMYRELARDNLHRWATRERSPSGCAGLEVRVLPGDWGDVTLALTKEFGVTFAVLNMANAYCPGGGYVEGCPAQEENMFRRTDCHFSIKRDTLDTHEMYQDEMSEILNGERGQVYLDTANPRVCVRGSEDRSRDDLGYKWLNDDQVFAFYELRAAAQDLRGRRHFIKENARQRIAAQLDTLTKYGVRHAVLSAFGCGAFANPADAVAALYRDEIQCRLRDFDVIAFAIFAPGYGPDNFSPFAEVVRAAFPPKVARAAFPPSAELATAP
uniref:Microbial-type PARG catalytic domain-containing protein n=1 Tax=Coccolithus braarudii TaxID=221442 RepID=A0A7S0PTM8_9EUKA|mmetsp:Transcript_10263/g.22294  ORF Transcript_10263/g.22294 Transcript_10263/m.22294 type:complete len:345 (+) Transcript_10263:51-1085(+)